MTGERRRYWLSLAALAVVLPAAIAVNSWQSLTEWRRSQWQQPIAVARGTGQSYAGAEWRLTGLTRLPGETPDTALIVAEFDASVDDPVLLQAGRCTVAITDDKGRRWLPTFATGRALRRGRPAAADKPRCYGLTQAEKGKTIAMAESFTVPEGAAGLALAIGIGGAMPAYLLFK